jgi:hypothetical protein
MICTSLNATPDNEKLKYADAHALAPFFVTVNDIELSDIVMKIAISVLILETAYLHCFISYYDYCQLMDTVKTNDRQI